MSRAVRPSLLLVAAIGAGGCRTDVSRDVDDLGTQGYVVTGLTTGTRGIAAGRDGVFFVQGKSIEYCPRTGCSTWTEFYAGADIARVVTDDRNVYWTEIIDGTNTGGRVLSCPQEGCGGAPLVIAAYAGVTLGNDVGSLDLGFLAVESGQVYFATYPGTLSQSLIACPITGCTAAYYPYTLAEAMTPFAVRGGTVYGWAAYTLGSAIIACPAVPSPNDPVCNTNNLTVLVSDTYDVGPTAIDGTRLYFVGNAARRVFSCTLPACADITQVVDHAAQALAVGNGSIYADSPDLGFATCNLGSCPLGPQPLDLPFAPTAFPQIDPAPSIVADANGAYAYAAYLPDAQLAAIVYLPAPGAP